jgi:hypothetical protein
MYPTPKQVRRETTRWTPTVIFVGVTCVIIFAIIFLVGWQVPGWFQQHGIQRSYNNTVDSQAYQTSLANELGQHLTNISSIQSTRISLPASSPLQSTLRAQQLSELREFCGEAVNYDPQGPEASSSLTTTIAQNCTANVVAVNPPLVPAA